MSEHSNVMGGSTASRRINCPGSYHLEKDMPREESGSEHAERGTALHEAMEHYLLAIEPDGGDMDDLLGMVFNKFEITQHLLTVKLKPALAAFQEIIKKMGGDVDFMVEARASMGDVLPGAFGTIDVLGRSADGRLLVLDWKFGDGVKVAAEASIQHGFYAACALYEPDDEDIKDIVGTDLPPFTFAVVQPREGRPNEPDYSMWETDGVWVEDLVDQMVAAFDKMKSDTPIYSTGSHCRWCPAKRLCPEQQKVWNSASSAVAPKDMDPITLATWLDRAEALTDFIADLKAHAHAEQERGVQIPGWKLVPKRGSRAYNNQEAAEAAARKMSGIKVSEVMTQTLKTPKQLEDAMKGAGIRQKRIDAYMAEHVSMISSGTTMARDSDTRPDVSDPLARLAALTADNQNKQETVNE